MFFNHVRCSHRRYTHQVNTKAHRSAQITMCNICRHRASECNSTGWPAKRDIYPVSKLCRQRADVLCGGMAALSIDARKMMCRNIFEYYACTQLRKSSSEKLRFSFSLSLFWTTPQFNQALKTQGGRFWMFFFLGVFYHVWALTHCQKWDPASCLPLSIWSCCGWLLPPETRFAASPQSLSCNVFHCCILKMMQNGSKT